MNKKLLGIAIFILLAATVAAVFYLSQLKKDQDPQVAQEDFSVEKADLEDTSKYFPAGLPIENGSTLLEKYEAKSSAGGIQATIKTTTAKTLKDAVADYVEFFESNQWVEIDSLYSEADGKVMTVLKNRDERVRIVAENNAATNEPTVEVTLTTISNTQK